MTVYTLIFSIVFLVIYTFFTFLWRFLIRSVFIREENHQAEKIREFNSAISKTLDLQEILDRTIRVMKEFPDVDKRIAATSDYVKNSILFSASKVESDTEYVAFMNNLMDYNKDSETKEASAVLSGLVQFVVKLGLN